MKLILACLEDLVMSLGVRLGGLGIFDSLYLVLKKLILTKITLIEVTYFT